MKAKSLSFAFISFLESGFFNGLPAIQIKKLSASASRHGHVGNAYLSALLYAAGLARDRRSKRKYAIEFDFLQMNVSDPLNAARLEPRAGLVYAGPVYVDDTAGTAPMMPIRLAGVGVVDALGSSAAGAVSDRAYNARL